MTPTLSRKKIVTLTILLSIGILATLGIVFQSNIHNELARLNLIQTDEHFTELYFDNFEAFSSRITVPHQSTSLSFSIHNLQGETTTYPYSVFFMNTNGKKITLGQGTVTLADNEIKSISVPYSFSALKGSGRVIVLLINKNQQIDFLVPKIG